MSEYMIDYATGRALRKLTDDRDELAAIDRLLDFRGTATDLETASAVYDRAGEHTRAADLREML